jgi:hypothetical protein
LYAYGFVLASCEVPHRENMREVYAYKRQGGKIMPKYGPKAQEKVEKAMREMKEGKLKSGKSGRKVTNPKQAVAIGLSEARKAGGKVPAEKK